MKLLEFFSNGAPDIATDSTSMDDAALLRNAVRKKKKDIKWITRSMSRGTDNTEEEPELMGDGDGNDDEL